jgi:ribosomal-protein-alanine N-acetyltransferase
MVRRATDDDLKAIITLWRDNILTSNTPEDIARAYRKNRKYFFVAENDGKILGFVAGTVKSRMRGHISGIAVTPENRGKGIGKGLLGAVENAFTADGFEKVTLEVRPSNVEATNFYEGREYRRMHIVRGYYFDGEDAVNYEKLLKR